MSHCEEKVVSALLRVIFKCKRDRVLPELIILGYIKTKDKIVEGAVLLSTGLSSKKVYELEHGLTKSISYKPSNAYYFMYSDGSLVRLSEVSGLLLYMELMDFDKPYCAELHKESHKHTN